MKSQTWSHDQIESGDEKFAFQQLNMQAIPRFQAEEKITAANPDKFDVQFPDEGGVNSVFSSPPKFWESLLTDPVIKAEFDVLVGAHVEKRLATERPAFEAEVRKTGYQEGLQQGLDEGRAKAKLEMDQIKAEMIKAQEQETKSRLDFLNGLVGKFQEDRDELLHSHEKEWGRAMFHLLQRFQVDKAALISRGLRQWLSDVIPTSALGAPVTIYVSPQQMDWIRPKLEGVPNSNWTLLMDTDLSETAMRFEVAGGGVVFDEKNEYAKLLSWLKEFEEKNP